MKSRMNQRGNGFPDERRAHPRRDVALGVQVYAYGVLVAHGATLDMSAGGVRLSIRQDLSGGELEVGKYLDVMFAHGTDERREEAPSWQPVRVVRRTDDSLAAVFLGAG